MLTLRDMIDFCELTGAEVDSIAEHERLSQISSAALGSALLESGKGAGEIERFIRENLDKAKLDAKSGKVKELEEVLRRFKKTHAA